MTTTDYRELRPARPLPLRNFGWDEIVKKALAKNRDERYATVKEFATAVRDAPVR